MTLYMRIAGQHYEKSMVEDSVTMLRGIANILIGLAACAWLASAAAAQQDRSLVEQVNQGTVGIISGGINGTYVRIAADLASVLDNGNELRVLPMIGKGSVQNIADILYLKGIDIGIVQSDVLTFIKRENIYPQIDQKIQYVTKLYNEEIHLIAGKDITSTKDLAGKQVNFGVRGSGTFMTATIVFDALGLNVDATSFDQGLAMEKVKSGEIAALVYVAGKPTSLFRQLGQDSDVHFLPIDYSPKLLETYLPARLTGDDYPGLVPADAPVDTLAVGAVMAVYNWNPEQWRYRKVSRFIDAFFTSFTDLELAPRHPKWKEVNISAELPGWTRFAPAKQWLAKSQSSNKDLKSAFKTFLDEKQAEGGTGTTDSDELFRQFIKWQKQQTQ